MFEYMVIRSVRQCRHLRGRWHLPLIDHVAVQQTRWIETFESKRDKVSELIEYDSEDNIAKDALERISHVQFLNPRFLTTESNLGT